MKCCSCGAVFIHPNRMRRRENLDGEQGWWYYTEELCPECGAEHIEEEEQTHDDQ